jgi:hypothetical protein
MLKPGKVEAHLILERGEGVEVSGISKERAWHYKWNDALQMERIALYILSDNCCEARHFPHR